MRRWSRERLQFVLWYSKKLDPNLYKKAGIVSCTVCHAHGYPVLQRSCDFVGEVLWACAECGTTIAPAEKTARARKNRRSNTARVVVHSVGNPGSPRTPGRTSTPMCAICRRTQSEVEASGSRLEKHHRIPLSDGGEDTMANLVVLCRECHEAWHMAHQKVRDELKEQATVREEPPAKGLWQRFRDFLGF